ncbi:MAG TPA: MFS transporter [Candidatus Dormibacteraeota bacterium]
MLRDDLRRWIALLVVCFGQLMIVLDSTIVNVALPSIQGDLGFSEAGLTWVVNAYSISFGGFVLLAGRLGDLVGRKRVFLAGVLVFTMASVLCGVAPAPAVLVIARFVQGMGAALSAGVIIALIISGFAGARERAQAMSVFAFTIAGGGSLGLLAGGFLTQAASWHWVFFINLPIGLATFLAGLFLIDDDRGAGLGEGLDLAGSLLVTSAVMLGVYAIITAASFGWASAHTLGFGGTAILLLGAFFRLQSRRRNAILPPRVLRIRSLAGASAARALLATGMFTTFFLGALYLQQARGYSSFGTGLAFLPFTGALGAMSLGITVRLVGRFGPRRVLAAGLVAIAAALFLLSGLGPETALFPRLFVALAIFGTGAGMSIMPMTLLAMADVPPEFTGLAAGMTNLSLQLGAAVGLAVLGTVAAQSGYQLAFAIAAGLVTTALLVVLITLRPPRPRLLEAVGGPANVDLQEAA